jgi:diamine N-acetyltransferase
MSYSIRKALPTDLDVARAICTQNFSETWGASYSAEDLQTYLDAHYSVENFQRVLKSESHALFFLETDGQVIGHSLCGPNSLPHADATAQDLELKRMYVLKAFHNRGLGTRLMDAAMTWMQDRQPKTIWIGVYSENFGAQRFYQRYGFSKAGEYTFIVGATHDHEFIYKRDLS